ncbi:MAG: hypothetical protein UY23_C0001G0380 [Candidatus Jorgensenbacteria bacterium GW2011_GWA1_48_11]|uniref:DUF4015 domain-containing protein n=1 Tax=Candidatus Jorgensenbacteria bacterium GW2011_GWA1_48_11 TaxID=1618660 RepID=A0A0G1UCD3_9BACT|nr:MAG: hypothetical protein UY23_C0001G0380 [Candidatus Jorgensenbacteria bacterium GW2011_GWA1_48_11]KKW12265.1 MAG: hypothetical protein UY51_C0005G0507 [Candidatus Jorgensenbacteria bacterium GW2011_GWB1_49_9]
MTEKQWRSTILALVAVFLVVFFFIPGEGKRPAQTEETVSFIPPLSIPMASVDDVRAIYLTAQTAARPERVQALIDLVKTTELNAVVINVKDSDGIYLDGNMRRVVEKLLANGIYPIARMVVFQDNFLARTRPELALKNRDNSLWRGNNGALWIDPASIAVWDYNANIAEEALAIGFKEINLDYIRFPSDGDVSEIVYPFYNASSSKSAVMRDFFDYFSSRLKADRPQAVLSADLFAFSFIQDDGLGVGQRVPVAAEYFDVLSPMIYPSHYTPGNFGFENPAEHPYEVVSSTLASGQKFFPDSLKKAIVRPWLQSFNLGAEYTPAMVRQEIQALLDRGFRNSWMLWNPNNVYNPDNFLKRREYN